MTRSENEDFCKVITVSWPLDDALIWIRKNLKPDEVFTADKLNKWAEDAGWVRLHLPHEERKRKYIRLCRRV
jgi:hypothetical protein